MGSFLLHHRSVIRKTEAPDGDVIEKNVTVANGIVFISFDDLDERAGRSDYNTHVVRPTGAVAKAEELIPCVIDVIAGQWYVIVIFFPAAYVFPETDLALTAAFCGNNIG